VDEDFRTALAVAKENIERYQRHIVTTEGSVFERDGVRLESAVRPLRRVGVYVPGGTAAYPSCVLMDVIPAQVAGCDEIAVATPAAKMSDHVMAAFHILRLREVYRVGGATAIGMLAYGSETVAKVDMIVGAGATFVTLAKREVCGTVKIDMFAGPSEVLVIADESANPDYVAADLLSQAEHYPGAAMLVSDSQELIAAVETALDEQLRTLAREEMCRECLDKYGALVKVRDLDEAVAVANLIAPEHLEIMAAEPRALAAKIENAGTVFLGEATPEAAGDYVAGSSHTLPTGGTARYTSGLSALDFLKRITFMEYTGEALERELPHITAIARSEGLEAHARAAEIRFTERLKGCT
jgi:histidinol dehydrogenase